MKNIRLVKLLGSSFYRFWFLMAMLSLGLSNAQSQSEPFFFVQLTDTHLRDSVSFVRTRKVIDQINNLPVSIDFVVHTGDVFYDQVSDSLFSQAEALWQLLRVPFYMVPGNHDLTPAIWKQTELKMGPFYYVKEHKNVRLIFGYFEQYAGSDTTDRYAFNWLNGQLAQQPNQHTLIFTHKPFFEGSLPAPAIARWTELIGKYPIDAVICGHLHAELLAYNGRVPIMAANAVADLFGRQASFRLYYYNNGILSYRTYYIEG